MASVRLTPVAYHGIQNVKFAPKAAEGYAEEFISLPHAKNLGFTSLLEDAEVYGDNRLLLRVPNDRGYTIEFGRPATFPELEKAAGYAVEGPNGVIGTNVAQYLSGAVYCEFIEIGKDKRSYAVKVWVYNVEIGKGSPNHSTDTRSLEFGEYKYPGTVYGDPLMDSAGTAPYRDELGMERLSFMYTARPGDTGYDDFEGVFVY